MNASRTLIVPLVALFTMSACAMQRYHPAPLVPSTTAERFESRNLTDPGLQRFADATLGDSVVAWPPKTWNVQTLSLAAFYFNPALDSSRARVAATEAAIVTAGARPNPTVSLTPGLPFPYLLTLDFALPIETRGKRGDRIQIARHLDQAARFDLADATWTIRGSVRLALVNYLTAARTAVLLREEAQVRGDQVAILDRIRSVGEIPNQDVDVARIAFAQTQVAIRTAEGQVGDAKAALAAAVGIPVAAFDGVEFAWPEMDTPPSVESLSARDLQRDAVLNRLDIRRALAQYAAAEANVQLEIAKQYPDVNIGPGYTFEEQHSFFTVGLSVVVPVFNRNEGPIAEADARRKEAAAAFVETQARVIARSERALAVYTAALREVADAEALRRLQEGQRRVTEQAIRVGATTRLSLDGVDIQVSVLERAHLDALARAQRALGDLEDAVQHPLTPEGMLPFAPETLLKIVPVNR